MAELINLKVQAVFPQNFDNNEMSLLPPDDTVIILFKLFPKTSPPQVHFSNWISCSSLYVSYQKYLLPKRSILLKIS